EQAAIEVELYLERAHTGRGGGVPENGVGSVAGQHFGGEEDDSRDREQRDDADEGAVPDQGQDGGGLLRGAPRGWPAPPGRQWRPPLGRPCTGSWRCHPVLLSCGES